MRDITSIVFLSILIFNSIKESILHENDPIVATKYGKVRGNVATSREGKTFYEFKGIPFAEPPIGDLRFKSPLPPKPWQTIRDAKEDGPACIQKNYLFSERPPVEGKEDCLYLNVYTPKLPNSESSTPSHLSVMVFIHYGGFFAGTGRSDYAGPHYFMDKDVVLVTFNYRLGVFGFLSTNDDASPGNYGLKDQVLALRWVKENIDRFGGKSNNVTIFGVSAGAGSTHYHLFSPQTKDLFQQAISQSGSVLALWARPTNQLQALAAQQQAAFVKCDPKASSHDMVECLRKVNANTLADSADLFKYFSTEPYAIYGPVTEKQTPLNPEPYITEDPLKLLLEGKLHKIPWLAGVVSDEGILRASPLLRNSETRKELNENFNVYGPQMLAVALSVAEKDIPLAWKNMTDYFLHGDHVNISDKQSVQGFINLYSDRSFIYGSYQSALLQAWKGSSNVWFYKFKYRGDYSYGDLYAGTKENIDFDWGVCHTDDLLYLFSSPKLFPPLKSSNDVLMSKTMVQMWTDFAIKGDPSPRVGNTTFQWNHLPDLSGLEVVKNSDLYHLNINGHDKFEIRNDLLTERMHFWESLPLAENIEGIQ